QSQSHGTRYKRYVSSSWGLFDEEIRTKKVELFSRTMFDTKALRITSFGKAIKTYTDYYFDHVAFAWNIDTLEHKIPSVSPYSAFGGNRIYNVDIGGALKYPAKKAASYTRDYPMLTKYLSQHVQRDVMNSPHILQGLEKYSEGNLTKDQVRNDYKWGEKTSP